MRKFVFILSYLFTTSILANTYFHPYVDDKMHMYNILMPYQVVVIQDIPYAPYPEDIVEDFKERIVEYSFEYQKYALERRIIRPLPFEKFIFKIGFDGLPKLPNNGRYNGYCRSDINLIYLEPYFSIRTFFHELGHCDLGYSHKEDKLVVKNGKSKYLMNWYFNTDHYNMDLDTVLDNFFDHTKHNTLHSCRGHKSHQAMVKQEKEYKKKSKMLAKNVLGK